MPWFLITYGGKEIIKTDFEFITKTLENGDSKSLAIEKFDKGAGWRLERRCAIHVGVLRLQ